VNADRPSEIDVYEQVISDLQSKIRTLEPGKVVKYDAVRLAAKVQPLRRGKGPTGAAFEQAVLPAVPILWPCFGGIVIRGKLHPGDDIMLAVVDRELDPYLQTGALHDPVSDRKHALADAVGLLGLRPRSKPLKGEAADPAHLYIGREDGTAYLEIGIDQPGIVTIEAAAGMLRLGSGATEPAVLGLALRNALTAFTTAVSGATGGDMIANSAAIETIGGAATALGTALAGILATKVRVQ
jgi:Phage protein Gp138 N-terminal domain